jgi:polyhydroxybutyrate depolymerase
LKRIGKRYFRLTLTFLAAAACSRAGAPPAAPTLPNPPTFTFPAVPTRPVGDFERTLNVAGLERSYLLHVPSGVDAHFPVPLVLAFHGHRMDAEDILAMSHFNDAADTGRFLVAYPNGTGPIGELSFNAGLCCGSAMQAGVDEAEFVRRILADLEGTFTLDPARVYVTGFSNGALLAYRLACEMSDTFAAFAPVDGNLMFGPCRPRQKVSLIHIQGLSDQSAPYSNEDLDPDTDPNILSVEGSVAFWASADGCSGYPAVEQDGVVTRTVYSSCARGIAVELISLRGIGHTWPADTAYPATQTIWGFFAAHPKP